MEEIEKQYLETLKGHVLKATEEASLSVTGLTDSRKDRMICKAC